MNIFFLHPNPRKCARWHCDKHVVKMILESCQLLYTSHWAMSAPPPFIECAKNSGYKPTHAKHPCSLWLLESLDNYRWLVSLAWELCREYTFRYGKRHACEEHLEWLSIVEPVGLVSHGFTMPRQAMPDHYKSKNSVVAYRTYYINDKLRIATYKCRERPHWFRTPCEA